jgi:hypothetical protein
VVSSVLYYVVDLTWGVDLFGAVISKLINRAVPDQIDERALNLPKPGKTLNKWEMQENANLAIGAAQSLGCKIVNIHAGMWRGLVCFPCSQASARICRWTFDASVGVVVWVRRHFWLCGAQPAVLDPGNGVANRQDSTTVCHQLEGSPGTCECLAHLF